MNLSFNLVFHTQSTTILHLGLFFQLNILLIFLIHHPQYFDLSIKIQLLPVHSQFLMGKQYRPHFRFVTIRPDLSHRLLTLISILSTLKHFKILTGSGSHFCTFIGAYIHCFQLNSLISVLIHLFTF